MGTALIERSIATAGRAATTPLHLTTYRNVAWNKPFYSRRGFVEVPRGDSDDRCARSSCRRSPRPPVWQRALLRRVV